jgi:hypothetical protein
LRYENELKSTFCKIVDSILNLSDEHAQICRDALDRYIIAARKETIDVLLIYIHSCLDVLIKHYDKSNDPFSKKLLHVCQNQGIAWKDLYPELSEEDIEKKQLDFPINKLRNKMLHEGEYSDNHHVVMDETGRARCLAERIILNMLGIDYVNSGFGVKDRFY